ncbi:MAG TPA: hypothetical protein DHV26_17940 [Cytophagales bacterium]|nr:hypothetical protein [Cytophagales bacterium]
MKILISLVLIANTFTMLAQKKVSIQVGDKAPPLNTLTWLRGDPLTSFKPGQYYVLEFSTVSCPPCRKSIPHLAELTRRYQGKINFINVYSSEFDREDDAYIVRIKNLFEKLNQQMPFAVAIDNVQASGKSYGVHSWPDIFVINHTGHVVWRGFLVNELDAVLEKLLAATLNPQAEKIKQSQFSAALQEVEQLKKDGDFLQADQQLKALMTSSPENRGLLLLTQFLLWAGQDASRATAVLETMLENGEDVLWVKLTSPVTQHAAQLPEHLVNKVLYRAFQETVLPEMKASILIQQAHLFKTKALNSKDDRTALHNMYVAQTLIDSLPKVDTARHAEYKTLSLQYQYTTTVLGGSPNETILQDFIKSQPEQFPWTVLIGDVIKIQNITAIKQLMAPVSTCIEDAALMHQYSRVASFGERKAQMMALLGNREAQEATYKKLIVYFSKVNDTKRTTFFKTRLDAR